MDALQRVSQQLKPQVQVGSLDNSVYGRNTNTQDATLQVQRDLEQSQQYYNGLYSKTGSDYARDAAVALGKGIVAVPQAAAGLVDLADAGLQAVAGADVQGGRFTKALDDAGVRFKETQDIMGGLYSEGTQRQLQGLAALPGMSTEKSLGDNLSSLGQTAGYVLDNPSLALNTIIESVPAIAAGGVVGRGAAALGARGAAGAIGEGTLMAGQAQANMDRNAEGYTTGQQALGALGIGVLGGAVGQLGNRFASRQGAVDIDTAAAGITNQAANKGFASLATGTATEAAEEAAQTSLENVISNITSGKDAIQGLNQDLVLGTLAGAGMGAATNAKSSLSSAALEAVTQAAVKQSAKIKERIATNAPEQSDKDTADLSNPSSPVYNPTAAIIREASKATGESTPEELSAIKQNVDTVMESAETKLAELTEMKSVLQSEAVWTKNLANAQAALQNIGDTDPDKSAKIQAAIEQVITPKLEQIEQVKAATTIDKLDGAIAHATGLVKDARVMHDKYSPMFDQASGSTDSQIFGAPTSYSLDQIQAAINDASISDTSKVALRALSDAVVAQNAVKDLDAVNQQVTGASLDPNYMSTPQYLDQFGAAVQRGSTTAQSNLLSQIGAFEQSHVAKAKLTDSAFKLATRLGKTIQVVRANDQWVVNTGTPLKGDAKKTNAALDIHPAKNGKKGSADLVNYMNTEATAITATRTAMEAMQQAQTPTQTKQAPEQSPMDFDSAMDSYNQEARDENDFQPQQRIEDPRDTQTRPSTPTAAAATTDAQAEVQPTKGTTSKKPVPPPSTQEYELVFDENGVGRNVPKVAKTERVTSRSDSEDAVTEVQASVTKAVDAVQDVSTEATADELVVVQDTKVVAEPQDINETESPDAEVKSARKEERAKEPKKRNLVIDGFNQKETVLNKNPNFMSRFMMRENNAPVVTSVTGLQLNDKQKQVMKDFSKFVAFMSPKLDGVINERKGVTAKGNDYSDFRFQDFNQFLLEDGQLPENVKTAISTAMFTWLAENGSKTLNTEKDVIGLLLLNNVDSIPNNVFNQLTAVGDHQSVVVASLGQKALQALGLKVTNDVDPARKAKLESGLGTLAAVLLTRNGYLERSTMPKSQFESLQAAATVDNERAEINDSTVTGSEKTLSFLRPKADAQGTPVDKVDRVIKSAAETGSIVNKLFDVQSDNKLPSLEPVETVPNSFNRMGSQVPDFTKEVYEKSQKNGYKMSAAAMTFMDKVSDDDLKTLFGYIKPNEDGESFDGMHKKFWKGQHAANQALERSIALIKEQRVNLGGDDKPFYFEHTIWTNQRSGYDSAFNLQANKVHRAVAGMADHVVEIGIEPTHKNGETTKFGEFLMAVAMSAEGVSDVLGIKTVDKMSSESFLPKFQEYLARDYVQDGIESMVAVLETKSTKEDIANIQRLVNEFEMGPMSVRAIQALAQMHIAERDGAKTFISDIAFESDGVTNGPVITNVALNTADADMLEAGGVFTDKNKTNVPTNKEQGSEDIYEQLGKVMKQEWAIYKNGLKPMSLKAADALDTIYNVFGERKGAKPITTTSNYGAGIASIKRANGREVLNAFYKGLEKAGNKGDMVKAQQLIDAVNATIEASNFASKTRVPLAVATGDVMEFLLTPAQEAALLDTSYRMHGEAINTTLKNAMADFQSVRDTLTSQAVTGFKVYDLVRKQALEEALADTADVIVDSKGTRQEGLTSVQEKAALKKIAKYTPSVVSGMGSNSANAKQSSIPLMKQDTAWDGSAMSKQQYNFTGTWDSATGKGFSVTGSIKRDVVTDPGVSGLALIIQSLDAFIAHSTLGAMPVQNFHDANASAVGQGKAMAKIQNEAFVDGLMTTHVNREFVRALMNPLQKLVDDKAFFNANATEITDALAEMDSLADQVKAAYARDMAKLNGMKSWENVNQYGTQGGHFAMTDAKRSEIVKAVDKLKKDFKKDLAQAEAIDAITNKSVEPTTIQDFLERDGTMTGADLVPKLQAELKQFQDKEGTTGKFSQFYDAMLDLITERMPAGLEINYFSEADAPSNVSGLDEAIANSNPAWFTTGTDGKPQINILRSTEPVKAQVLVHELVHAITVDSIAQVRNEPVTHAKAKESLDKIDALYEFIKAEVKADPNATDLMKYATQNVEEFIATGFSYPEFVDYLDSKLAPKAARGKNRIVTALRSFVENILGVLESFTGRKYSAKDATALEALILDSTEFLGRTKPTTVGTQSNIFGAPQQARDNVAGYTSKQVFDALDSNLDESFKFHLGVLMTNVSDTIYAGLNQSLINNPDGTWSVEKAWEEHIKAGKVTTTETATTAGFRMTEQESFAVESLYAALVHGLKDKAMTQVYAEMDKSFKSARAKLKPQDFFDGDWNTADKDDKQDAQDMYDFVFKYSKDNPEPLARFTAMALGSQQFNTMLGFSVKDADQDPKGLFEKIINGVNDLVDYVGGLLTNSSSAQLVNNRLGLLSKELARIDAKNRDFAVGKVEAQLEKLADHTDAVSQKLRDKVVELADKDVVANSRFTSVRLASNVTRLSAKGDLWTTLDVIKDGITQYNPNERLGIVGEIINEAANNDDTKTSVEKMLRITKLNNQMKENLRDTTSKNVMSTFDENGAYLTVEDKQSITTMLRSDVQSLTDSYGTAEIAKMYSDAKYLANEIQSFESRLADQVMANRAKQLAKYMITGKSSNGLAKNAQLIVSGFTSGEVVDAADPRVTLVDMLASMYAIQYTSNKDKARLNTIMKRELANKTNGIDTSIKFHKELSKEARKTLFVDNPTSAIKGFMPEITNPNREVRVAVSEADARLLTDQFYREVKTLSKDAKDPSKNVPRLFITEEANIQRLVSGAIEVVSTNRKGSPVTFTGKEFHAAVTAVKNSIPTSAKYNPMEDPDVYMTPNYNTQNEIIGFSYEMSGKNRDTLLERNNDFSDLLGAYAATNFNKTTVPEQNNRVVDAALEDYKDNFAKNPRAYVTVGPNSADQGLREVWAMLPEDTRKHVIAKWGKDGMQVRNDVLLAMFGYRKYSLNQSFDKMDEAKNMFEKLYTGLMTEVFGSNAKIRGVQAERAWQEGVSLMKDIIVIRNVKTMFSNIMSNAMLLMAHGVSTTDIVKDTLTSVRAGMQYRRDTANLISSQQKQRAGVGDFNKLEQDILRLQDSLARNPLASFIEEGMMPTIVEDVDPDTNHYSYKNKLQQRIDSYTESVPKSVKTAAKWAFVSPDTPAYKLLNNATQFSDFSSKYVMYKYYTQKAKEKMSHDEAIQTASDNFVNYDVPTARGLQYLNDMGVVMFTKYNIRIQKALFQLLKKRPATAMAQAVFINSFTNLEAGIDPLIWFNMGNPMRGGALGLPSALDEPLPISMMTSVF